MKLQIASLLAGMTMLTLTSTAQANKTDSLEKVKQSRAENAAKADVYILKKSQGNMISEVTDSTQVKAVEVSTTKNSGKTRKVSCSSKNYQKKKS